MTGETTPRMAEVTITVTEGETIELLQAARDCLLQHCVDSDERDYEAAEAHLSDLRRQLAEQVPWRTGVLGVDESEKEERSSG